MNKMYDPGKEEKTVPGSDMPPDDRPIEPKDGGFKIGWLKVLLFIVFMVYLIVSAFHTPILTAMGRYLIVEHSPENSDLIVCLSGGIVDRVLETADAYDQGLGPKLFIAREDPPDGYAGLVERGIQFPTRADLSAGLLKELGVPESALIFSDDTVGSLWDEAGAVKKTVDQHGFKSIILITSPHHTRRAWLTFNKVFDRNQIRIIVLPSRYSDFRPEDWWKRKSYAGAVIFEYQKLILNFFQ